MPAVSKAQQRFMGMVHAAQKGDMENPSKEVEKAADSMSKKDAKDYASTSHKGLPNKKESMSASITKERLKELVKEVMVEENEYQAFFAKALEKSGKSIPSMSDEEKKAFFDKIDTAWNGKGEKNEELVGGQKELDVDKDGDIEADDLADLRASKNEAISTELPTATIPSGIKMKLSQAIDKIKDAKLNPTQKLQLVAQVVDSLGIDKSQLGTITSKIKSKMESVNEGRYDADLDKIEAAVKNATSFMNVGTELKKAGIKYDFTTSMIPMYMIKVSGNTIAICNKKYAAGAEREVKDIAIGLLENKK
jgi:Ca2+-binding EF-hand superfamily protein